MMINYFRDKVLQHPKIKSWLIHWGDFLDVIIKNAGSLVGTQLVTSALGFMYWWLAARSFSAHAVGVASASISAMLLLGTIGVMGFGTLLMGMVRQERDQAGNLIASAIVVVGLAGSLFGLLFVGFTSWISSDLEVWSANSWTIALFAFSVGLTSIVFVIDQALIGLLRGSVQLWRNSIFALAKLGALIAISLQLSSVSGVAIYATWTIGNLLSVLFLICYAIWIGARIFSYRPKISILRQVGFKALSHHSLNLALQAPGLALPVIVTILVSAQSNAYFYASWMIASFIFVGPIALATVLYAVGSTDTALLAGKFRFTLRLSLLIGLSACVVIWIVARQVLWIFGPEYAVQGTWCLRILSLAVFPIIIKNLFVALHRINQRILSATRLVIIGSFLELVLAAAGAKMGGMLGLSIGWLIAVTIEGLFMSPPVFQIINTKEAPDVQPSSGFGPTQIWIPTPAIPGETENHE
jgi:O-antigen/teichoic acid export membrane protein